MDFIPSVQSPAFSPVEIPYLTLVQYDGRGFFGYPKRMGWDTPRLLRGDFTQQHSLEQTESFLQAWLYFGMLSEVLDVKWTAESFTRIDSSGRRWVTAARLPEHLKERKDTITILTKGERWLVLQNAAKCISEVDTVLLGASLRGKQSLLSPEIVLSIRVLESILVTFYWRMQDEHIAEGIPLQVVASLPGQEERLRNAKRIKLPPIPKGDPLLESHMLRSGWRKNDVARLCEIFSVPVIYFANFLSRSSDAKIHSMCSDEACQENNIDEASYVTKHAIASCTCHHLKPSQEEVQTILRRGGIPLVRFELSGPNSAPKLQVVQHQPNLPFVAISHVWSHGMGITTQNSLPICQVSRIQHLVKELYILVDRILTSSGISLPLLALPIKLPIKSSSLIPRSKLV